MKNIENQQNLKEQIKNAIRLYSQGGLSQSIAKAVAGELVTTAKIQKTQKFANAFKRRTRQSPDASGEYTFVNEEDNSNFTISYNLTDSEQKLITRVQELSKFAEHLDNAVRIISDCDFVKQAQAYLSNGTTIEGEDATVVQQCLDLIALINEEYTKASGKKKSPISEGAVIEAIAKKVLKQAEKFDQVDFSSESPVCKYFIQMAEITKSQKELAEIKEAYENRCGAVDVLNELRQRFAQYLFERDSMINTINGRQNVVFKKDADPSATLNEMMNDCSAEVLAMAKKGASVKDFESHQRKQVAEIEKAKASLKGVDDSVVRLQSAKERYASKYNEFLEILLHSASKICEDKGLLNVGGLVGEGISGNSRNEIQNAETGEWEIVGQVSDERILTDEDVLKALFTRVVLHESTIMSDYIEQVQQAEDSSSIRKIIASYEQKFEVANGQMEGDVKKILQIYSDLLDYKMRIIRTPYESKRAVMRYLGGFSPKIKRTGSPYFSAEKLEEVRAVGKKACVEALDFQKKYYNQLLVTLALGTMDYIDEMPIREIGQPIEKIISAEKIAKDTLTSDLHFHEKSIYDILKDSDYAIAYLKNSKNASKDLMEVLADERIEAKLNGVIPLLAFEVGHRTLDTWNQLVYGVGNKEKEKANLIAYDNFIKLDTISGKAYYQSDAFYRHLVEALPSTDKFRKQEQKRIREFAYSRMGLRALQDRRVQELLDAFDAYYIGWLNNLHIMEDERKEAGVEVLTENRDLGYEERVLEKGERHLRKFIGSAGEAV